MLRMKTRLLFTLVALSLSLSGFSSFPCIQSDHDCCQPVLNLSWVNPYTTCCDEDKDDDKGNPTLQSRVENEVMAKVAVADVAVLDTPNPSFIILQKIRNKSPPEVPIYISHQAFLL